MSDGGRSQAPTVWMGSYRHGMWPRRIQTRVAAQMYRAWGSHQYCRTPCAYSLNRRTRLSGMWRNHAVGE
eukprot:9293711-Lingulodinium_polyedra.AAC.1